MPPMPVTTTNDRKIEPDREALRDQRRLVHVGLEPAGVEPLERERDEQRS